MRRLALSLVLLLFVTAWTVPLVRPRDDSLPKIELNDNLKAAGTLKNDVLTLELEVTKGLWHLLGEDELPGEILAFAEKGRAPQNPGPMIRVSQGTEVRVSITNPLDAELVVHGLSARRVEKMEVLSVPPGATREARFTADVEGTYFYWGTTTGAPIDERAYEDSQLHGAFIVDPSGAEPADDRVLVLAIWVESKLEDGEPDFSREFFVINGRPWPHTERFTYEMGDSIRWRLINASFGTHPMHLHGFYYRVDARGDIARDTIYWTAQRRMAVTERLVPGTTMSMVWSPDRPGGWIFHCHNSFHVLPNPKMGADAESKEERAESFLRGTGHHDPNHHVVEGMGGLLLAMYIRPPEGWEPNEPKQRQLRLFVQSDSVPDAERPQFAYVLQEGEAEPAPDSVLIPGSTLVLWKGEPTSIWVINRTDEPTQVHWHGLEIESYFDGVAGVGGYPNKLTPAILPGDSFEMRITPPRAGSYMYHTHINDLRQQGAGLYGAFVVLEEEEEWKPDTDRILLIGGSPDQRRPVLNGTKEPEPMEFKVGETYRLRFMNITLGSGNLRVRLLRNGVPVRWKPVAKDGFDLAPVQQRLVEAVQTVSVGETFDFEYRPNQAGELHIDVRSRGGRLFVDQTVKVIAVEAVE